MLKKLINECHFSLKITTEGPLLVKSGYATPHGPDMTPVLTYRNGQEQVFIPGSSLKGVFRSHIEKVIRTLNEGIVCMPFEKEEIHEKNGQLVCNNYPRVFCGNKFELRRKDRIKPKNSRENWVKEKKELSNSVVYHDSCPACRLFGSTFFIGRVSINDAYLTEQAGVSSLTEQRDGVGIDRFTGGASSRAKFELEVVRAGVEFQTEVYLRNFETWQLGAIMLLIQDLEDKIIRIGSGRSRGLGLVKGAAENLRISYILPAVRNKKAGEVWGLGKFLGNDITYGTKPEDILNLEKIATESDSGIRRIQEFTGESLAKLKQQATETFVRGIQDWHVPITMEFSYLQFHPLKEES